MTFEKTGYYIFGLVQGLIRVPLLDLTFRDAPIIAIPSAGGVVALGCAVPLNEFGPEVVTERMNDLDWLGNVARTHYNMCAELCSRYTTFLPFRICTVFSDEAHVQEILAAEEEMIAAEFARLEGKAEFGLKLWGRAEWLERLALSVDPTLRALHTEIGQGGGKAYFARKRYDLALAETTKRLLPQLQHRIAATISSTLAVATQDVICAALPIPITGYAPVANISVLLDQQRSADFLALAQKLDRDALSDGRIDVLGPLPAFSFIHLGREVSV